jgi:hypothetical protein
MILTFIEKYAIIELYSKHKVKLFLNSDFRFRDTLSNVSDLYSLFPLHSSQFPSLLSVEAHYA